MTFLKLHHTLFCHILFSPLLASWLLPGLPFSPSACCALWMVWAGGSRPGPQEESGTLCGGGPCGLQSTSSPGDTKVHLGEAEMTSNSPWSYFLFFFFLIFFFLRWIFFFKSLLNLLQHCFCFMFCFFFFGCEACGLSAPCIGIKPHPLHWKTKS